MHIFIYVPETTATYTTDAKCFTLRLKLSRSVLVNDVLLNAFIQFTQLNPQLRTQLDII